MSKHTDDTKSFYVPAEQASGANESFVCNASTQVSAYLIAAAPDLPEACKRFMRCQTPDRSAKCAPNDEDFAFVRAAIAAAEKED
jgi:hypothetical protein